MSDEQNKDSLLVDQKDALGFYFDALLLPDENDFFDKDAVLEESKDSGALPAQGISNSQDALESESIKAVDALQADKDFLRASKLRQEMIQEKSVSEQGIETLPNIESALQILDPVQEKQTSETFEPKLIHKSDKRITEGPVSPKPRLKEPASEKQAIKKETSASKAVHVNKSSCPEIVFSSKNNDGEISEQVLIPRSQRLAAAKASDQITSAAKVKPQSKPAKIEATPQHSLSAHKTPSVETALESKIQIEPDKSKIDKQPQILFESNNALLKDRESSFRKKAIDSKESSVEKTLAPIEKNLASVTNRLSISKRNTSKESVTSSQQEAPKIDLSLFLPKIKTLSEEEIAQQIEALTQAAVSQAQLESDLAHVAELEQVSQKILRTQAEPEKDKAIQNIDNAPSWAVPNFQVLLFTVAGLKLAVPLTELNGIVEWGDEYISELPGHKSWYLGIIQNQGKSVPVIDTLQQVVPQNRWPANYLTERKFKHIIMIDNSRWGLACETVLEVVTLKTDAVKWRSTRTKRRWLMGTVIDHMCALLDSPEFAKMLKTGDDSLMNT